MPKEFTMIIEKDEDGFFVDSVPQLKGCHIQASSLDELTERIREAILLCLEVAGEKATDDSISFVGVQRVVV